MLGGNADESHLLNESCIHFVSYSTPSRQHPRSTGHVPVERSRLSSYQARKDSRGRILKRHFRWHVPRPQHLPVYFGASSSRAAPCRGISGRAPRLEAKRGTLRQVSVSDYVRTVMIQQASRELAAAQSQTIAMTPDERHQFWQALSKPPKLTKAQKELGKNHARKSVSGIQFHAGWTIELLAKSHNRQTFDSGNSAVNDWLRKTAFQSQSKQLTTTKVLLDETARIVGYYTLATSQVDFVDLPANLARSLPRRQLPVAVLAWFGVDSAFQSQGIGKRLLATALRDCFEAGETFAFIAVILGSSPHGDCRLWNPTGVRTTSGTLNGTYGTGRPLVTAPIS
jgi:GNAT superfamily N-acetyltransferase